MRQGPGGAFRFWFVASIVLAGVLVACARPDLTVGVPVPELRVVAAEGVVAAEEQGDSLEAPYSEQPPPAPSPDTTQTQSDAAGAVEATEPRQSQAPAAAEPSASPSMSEPVSAPSTTSAASRVEAAGLTDQSIKVGVVVDDETGGVADGRSNSAFLAVLAWAEAVNSEGGLAGRRVRVGLIDAGLFGHHSALAQVCEGDFFAIVGSDALFDDEGAELLSESSCELLDFPARANTPLRAASPITFLSVPTPRGVVESGALRALAERHPEAIKASSAIFVNFPSTVVATEQALEAALAYGFEFVYSPTVGFDVDFSGHAAVISSLGVESLVWAGDEFRLAEFLRAAAAESLDLKVRCAAACHSSRFAALAGKALSEGGVQILTWSPYLPLGEEAHSPELATYGQWLAEIEPDAVGDLRGVAAWASARLFEEAVRRSVRAGTPGEDFGTLSLQGVADSARGILNWNGFGLHGLTHPGKGEGTPCGVVLSVTADGWERVQPSEPGMFDCSPENLYELVMTAELGLSLADDGDPQDSGTGGDELAELEGSAETEGGQPG